MLNGISGSDRALCRFTDLASSDSDQRWRRGPLQRPQSTRHSSPTSRQHTKGHRHAPAGKQKCEIPHLDWHHRTVGRNVVGERMLGRVRHPRGSGHIRIEQCIESGRRTGNRSGCQSPATSGSSRRRAQAPRRSAAVSGPDWRKQLLCRAPKTSGIRCGNGAHAARVRRRVLFSRWPWRRWWRWRWRRLLTLAATASPRLSADLCHRVPVRRNAVALPSP